MGMSNLRSHQRSYTLILASILLTLDQVTKHAALSFLSTETRGTGLFRFELRKNPGAGFSILTNSTLTLTALSSLALVIVLASIPRLLRHHHPVLISLVLGGISGNLIDRCLRSPSLFKGHVVDFIAIGSFPVFNLADVFLTSAACIFILSQFKLSAAPSAREVLHKEGPTLTPIETSSKE